MMSRYFCKNDDKDLNQLSGEFKNWAFSYFDQSKQINNISVFCCQVKSVSDLKKEWQQINNYIASTFIFKNKVTFERWNTYLLFACCENIPTKLHYEIENNKFAMRKIVESHNSNSDIDLINILNQKIFSTQININQASNSTLNAPELSPISSRLLAKELNINDSKVFKEGRKKWLDAELEGININEN